MRSIRYAKWTAESLEFSSEDLMRMLGDFFLDSGFHSQWYGMEEMGPPTLEELRKALEQALEMHEDQPLAGMTPEQRERVVERLAQQLLSEGYLSQPGEPHKVEMTGKAVDFLGFHTLKELMGALGRASFGAHDTRDLSTGIEGGGPSRQYEFGDVMNLDATATLFSALRREGLQMPLSMEYEDLHVNQCEYQSSCATVLLLDCSHSMILYGEDRFTPAKKVALALAHLIRTKYPGDSLRCVLFHDTAEEVRLHDLARVQVGPYHTNTREGLILAQRLLAAEKKDMKQIIMITDGKPSAVTLPDGRIYKNPMGLDPLVMAQTYEEAGRCKRAGILINTFMLATDYALVQFVNKLTEMCRGKAYFTTAYTLGEYLLMDYMTRKTRRVH